MKILKCNQGIALVAAIVVTLIVSLVAVAIASTAVANRHLTNADYEVNASYVNAQAGLNMAETIIQTASGDELKKYIANFDSNSTSAIAETLSTECSNNKDLTASSKCFWWLGRTLDDFYKKSSPFLTKLEGSTTSGGSSSYLSNGNSEIYFKLEKRPEVALASLAAADTLGKNFYRVTSIAKDSSYNGLMKVQGQLQVFAEIDRDITVDSVTEDDKGPVDVEPNSN